MQSEENILQPHDPQTYRPPLAIRIAGRGNRIEIDVDNAVKKFHRRADGSCQLREIKPAFRQVLAQIDRTEIANGRLLARTDFRYLSAKIGKMYDVRWVRSLVRFQIAGILERHPTVSGFREDLHHSRIEFARFDLPGK